MSVVIPTYERPAYLPGAIETVLGQTYDPLEVIVVDDASETVQINDISAEYAGESERVRVYTHEDNRGPAAARNTGIAEANGEYIAFLDDDDRWHESKIERQMAVFQQCGPAVGVVSCRLASISPSGELLRAERSKPTGDLWPAILRENLVGSPSRIVVRQSCLDGVGGFDESLQAKQDWDLYIRLSRDWQFETLQEVLCYRTIHDRNLSGKPETAMRAFEAIRTKHEDAIRANDCWDAALANCHATVGIASLFRGHRRAGRAQIRRALASQPEPYLLPVYASTFVPCGFKALVQTKRWVERRITREGPQQIDPTVVPGTSRNGKSRWTILEEQQGGEQA